MYEVAEVTDVNDVMRRAVGRNLRALVYATLLTAAVNNAYFQIVIARVLYAGTIVMTGELGHRREIAGLELLISSVAATRFGLISAFVLCVLLLLVVSPACARLRGTRFGSLAWMVTGCSALGAVVGLALARMRYPWAIGDSWAMALSGMSAGGLLAFYLTRKLRSEP